MIASLTFTSCEDFLTEEVRGQQNLDTYFQSAEEAEAFITGCYQAITFGGWWNINTVWLLSEMCSDDGWMGNTSQSQSDYISLAHYQGTGQSNGAISNFGSIDTKAFYVAISQWNAFHKLISQMKK